MTEEHPDMLSPALNVLSTVYGMPKDTPAETWRVAAIKIAENSVNAARALEKALTAAVQSAAAARRAEAAARRAIALLEQVVAAIEADDDATIN
jgi:hypothetical protein